MNREDRKRLRELTIASHWQGDNIDWPGVYREMVDVVRGDEFYQDTRGNSDAYIAEMRRLRDVALDACPLCEHCDKPAYMLASTGFQRCGAIHLNKREALRVLASYGY